MIEYEYVIEYVYIYIYLSKHNFLILPIIMPKIMPILNWYYTSVADQRTEIKSIAS